MRVRCTDGAGEMERTVLSPVACAFLHFLHINVSPGKAKHAACCHHAAQPCCVREPWGPVSTTLFQGLSKKANAIQTKSARTALD